MNQAHHELLKIAPQPTRPLCQGFLPIRYIETVVNIIFQLCSACVLGASCLASEKSILLACIVAAIGLTVAKRSDDPCVRIVFITFSTFSLVTSLANGITGFMASASRGGCSALVTFRYTAQFGKTILNQIPVVCYNLPCVLLSPRE